MPSEGELLCPTKIQVSSEEKPTPINLPIRIIKSLDEPDSVEEKVTAPSPSTEFPAFHIEPLIPSSSKTVSVTELTTHAHCPTRFYLQHQIQVPSSQPQSEEAAETIREDGNRFLDSRVGEIALNADEVYYDQHIHAEIDSHIVEGTADRLFKNSRGLWQIINYERDRIDWGGIGDLADYYRSTNRIICLAYSPSLS